MCVSPSAAVPWTTEALLFFENLYFLPDLLRTENFYQFIFKLPESSLPSSLLRGQPGGAPPKYAVLQLQTCHLAILVVYFSAKISHLIKSIFFLIHTQKLYNNCFKILAS